jgi:hypothetical protein
MSLSLKHYIQLTTYISKQSVNNQIVMFWPMPSSCNMEQSASELSTLVFRESECKWNKLICKNLRLTPQHSSNLLCPTAPLPAYRMNDFIVRAESQ